MASASVIPDYHSRRMWTERRLAALPDGHQLAMSDGIVWSDLAEDTFLLSHGGAGPQVHDHIALRLSGRRRIPSILRFDIERLTLLSMIAQGFGVTIVGNAGASALTPGVVFVPILDESELAAFSGVWSPHNRSPALAKLLALAAQVNRSTRPAC